MNKYYNTDDIAEMLDIHVRTVRNWIVQGELPAIKVGNRYRIDKEEFKQYLEDRRVQGSQD